MVSTSRRGRGQVGSRRQPGLSDGAPTLGTVLDWADDPRVRWVHRSPAVPGETAAWPSWLPPSAVARFEERGIPRAEALRQMVAAYSEHMHTNEPVHTWPLP